MDSRRFVKIKAFTWPKDTHQLFDHETHITKQITFDVTESVQVLRTGFNVSILDLSNQRPAPENYRGLASIYEHDNSVYITGKDFQGKNISVNEYDSTYLTLRNAFDYVLHEGDVFRLGRVEYKVVEVSGPKETYNSSPVEAKKVGIYGVNSPPTTDLRSVKKAVR
jgi:hypothetical protein